MAEALGVAASIITIVQITKEIVALAKRNIHTTDHAHSVLSSLLGRLTAYKGLFEGLQLQAESHEADAIRLSALDHVGGPLEACKESLSFIKDALQRPRGKLWIGKVLNKDIMKALEKLDQLRPILQTALEADQRVLLAAIEDYAKNISQDLHKLQSTAEDLQENVKSSINDQELWREEVTATRKAAEGLAKRKNILDWISTLDQSGRHQILIEAHHSGTNEWFMRSLDFTEWFTCKSTNLWLYGTVGSGKSVQSALIIQYTELARTETLDATKALGYYFFDDNDNDEQSVTGFLCSLIKQLSIDFGNLPEVVKELYAKYSGDRNCNSIKQEYLIETLAAMIDLHSSTCVVLDAIDELPESDIYSLFGILEQLSGRSGTKLQFFCTSRPTQIISDEVTRLGWRSTTMNVEEIDKDVSKYVKDCLGSKRSFSQLEAGLKESICSRILQRTQGMFLLAKLQLESLEKVIGKVKRAKDILHILESWPPGIFGMYEKMLGDIPETCREELRRALLLISFSKIPVTLAETAEFAVITPGSSTHFLSDRFGSPEELLLLSGSLFINSESRLYLSHHSIQEYLISDHIKAGSASFFAIDMDKAAEEIFHICLIYLKFLDAGNPGTHNGLIDSNSMIGSLQHSSIQELNHDYPLANLASLQWISSPPAFFERYKDDVEFVLTSHRCLILGFWWVVHRSQSPASMEILPEAPWRGSLPGNERILLALILARSLLEFHSGPWMSSSWAINDLHAVSTPSSGGLPTFTSPYPNVRANMTSPSNGLDFLQVTPRSPHRRSDTLLALGILLLEISLGAPLDNFENSSPDALRETIVPGLINTLSENSGSNYARAVERCLSVGFGDATTGDTIDTNFREIIYRDVVQPLETAMQPYNIVRENMGLLAYAEASEDISAGMSRIKEAYLEFNSGPE